MNSYVKVRRQGRHTFISSFHWNKRKHGPDGRQCVQVCAATPRQPTAGWCLLEAAVQQDERIYCILLENQHAAELRVQRHEGQTRQNREIKKTSGCLTDWRQDRNVRLWVQGRQAQRSKVNQSCWWTLNSCDVSLLRDEKQHIIKNNEAFLGHQLSFHPRIIILWAQYRNAWPHIMIFSIHVAGVGGWGSVISQKCHRNRIFFPFFCFYK